MRLSDLIKQLHTVQERHGEVEVRFGYNDSDYGWSFPDPIINVVVDSRDHIVLGVVLTDQSMNDHEVREFEQEVFPDRIKTVSYSPPRFPLKPE